MTNIPPKSALQRARQLIRRMTLREKYGAIVLAACVGVYGLMELDTAKENAKALAAANLATIANQRAALARADWSDQASILAQYIDEIEQQFLRVSTLGLADAEIRAYLEQAAAESELQSLNIQIASRAEPDLLLEDYSVYFLEAQITAVDRGGRFSTFFDAFESMGYMVVASRFSWNRSRARLEITLLIPVILETTVDNAQ